MARKSKGKGKGKGKHTKKANSKISTTKKKGGVYQMGGADWDTGTPYIAYVGKTSSTKDQIKVTKGGTVGGVNEIEMKENYIFLAIEADNAKLDAGGVKIKEADKFRLLTTDELKNIQESIKTPPDGLVVGGKNSLNALITSGADAEIMKYKSPVDASKMVSLKLSDVNRQDVSKVPVVRMIVGVEKTAGTNIEVKSATPADDINNTTYILVINMTGGRTPEIAQRA